MAPCGSHLDSSKSWPHQDLQRWAAHGPGEQTSFAFQHGEALIRQLHIGVLKARHACMLQKTCQHLDKCAQEFGVHGLCVQDWVLVCLKVKTGSTKPIQPDGALMLGGDQDCYGGCTDTTQAYHGLMDEVRVSI